MKILATFIGLMSALVSIAASAPDASRGRAAFEKRCSGCHALDRVMVGPPLRAIFGRPAGRDSGFSYSDALRKSTVTWDAATLDRWLTDTETVVPGNEMAFRLGDAAERGDIIAYLKQLAGR